MAKTRKKLELPTGLRGALARNLATIMDRSPAFDSQPKIAAKSKIGQSTIGRILRAEVPVTLDNLEALAKGLTLEPWQLLVPGLDPSRPPKLGEASLPTDEREVLELYRGASSRWKIAIKYMAGLRHEAQQEEAGSYILSKIFATPVPDRRVEEAYGRPPQPGEHRFVVHDRESPTYHRTTSKKRGKK
jgi:transcriptional regulator with XRE-family HTH domain